MFWSNDHKRLKASLQKWLETKGADYGDKDFQFSMACHNAGINPNSISLADKSSLIEEVKANYAKTAFETAISDEKNKRELRGYKTFSAVPESSDPVQAAKDAVAQDKAAEQTMALFRRTSNQSLGK